ncbi:MAG: hypothetical protein CMO81_12565 [Waddliaceae bacterium]|nr:hypothetical protein [Waddliaceae bacterium]
MSTISTTLSQIHGDLEQKRSQLESYQKRYDSIVSEASTGSASIEKIKGIIENGKHFYSTYVLPCSEEVRNLENQWKSGILEMRKSENTNKAVEETSIKDGFANFLNDSERSTQKERLLTLLNPHQALAQKAHESALGTLRNSFTKYLSEKHCPKDWKNQDWDQCLLSSYCNEEYGNVILESEGLPTIEHFLPKLSDHLQIRWKDDFSVANY